MIRRVILPVRQCHRRGGYLYIAVMIVAVLVSLSGLSAVSVSTMRHRSNNMDVDGAKASRLAQSGIELGLASIQADPNWRSTFQNELVYPDNGASIDGGTAGWRLVDEDGFLDDARSDAVTMYGIGRAGDAVNVQSVRLHATGQPLDCLNAAFVSQATLALGENISWRTDQTISSNGWVIIPWGVGTTLTADVEASRYIWGQVIGTKRQRVPPRSLPGDSVFDYYLHRGTWIDRNDLPVRLSQPILEKCVFSPKINPYGAVNSSGIYVIDCAGRAMTISNCRIVGCLVLLNCTTATVLKDSVAWEPAADGMPSLLVDGSVRIEVDDKDLSELDLLSNFNPAGAPFEGASDVDVLDTYESRLTGLFYVSGRIWFGGDGTLTRFTGVTICGSATARASVDFTYSDTFFQIPPPGFAAGPGVSIIPGTWRRAAFDW